MNASAGFVSDFIQNLQSWAAAGKLDLPRSDANATDSSDFDHLVSTSIPVQIQLGTGASIYTTTLIPAILSARSEIILVTCFWAESKTLSALSQALATLASSRRAIADSNSNSSSSPSLPPLRVHICFSSRSLLQKLFHTSSPNGYTYPPSSWPKVLGLPSVEELNAGQIELEVKTLFFLPFSVMHPKFLIVDRQRAFIPSCNVSWEAWLEGCVEMRGAVVVCLLEFFARTWKKRLGQLHPPTTDSQADQSSLPPVDPVLTLAHHVHLFPPGIPTIVLPSSHHRNPRFRPFPWQSMAFPSPTPLNLALLQLLEQAKHSIYVQTPNLTSKPVLTALVGALKSGVDVTIVTNRRMMLLEQLVTAGTTTSWCLGYLVRRHRAMTPEAVVPTKRLWWGSYAYSLVSTTSRHAVRDSDPVDLEARRQQPGRLRISYFRPRRTAKSPTAEERLGRSRTCLDTPEEPVHSHLKLTIVDGEHTVLGSGNMDRASWYTSQELGVLFESREFASATMAAVTQVLDGRLDVIYDSLP